MTVMKPVTTVFADGRKGERERYEARCEELFERGYKIGAVSCGVDLDGNDYWFAVMVWPDSFIWTGCLPVEPSQKE